MPGRYEYRLYEGTFPTLQQSDAPLLIAIFRWLDAALTGLTIDSRTPLQQQLSSFVANSSFFQLPLPIMQTVVDLAISSSPRCRTTWCCQESTRNW